MSRLNKTLILFIAVTVIGLFIRYFFGEESRVWQFWSNLDVSFAVALGILAFLAYKDMIKDEDEIKIFFLLPNNIKIDTKLTILRKDATRSEILGLLGMIQKNPKERFTIVSLQTPSFLKELHNVQKDSSIKEILIKLKKDEIKQFVV